MTMGSGRTTPQTAADLARASVEALRKAENASNRASARLRQLEDEVRREQTARANSRRMWIVRAVSRRPPVVSERGIVALAEFRASDDPVWRAAVADNNWYMDQAEAYHAAAQSARFLESGPRAARCSDAADDDGCPYEDHEHAPLEFYVDSRGYWRRRQFDSRPRST